METDVVTGITAYGAAYIDDSMKDMEQVVGLQTDKPLKRAFMPYGGIKMAEKSCVKCMDINQIHSFMRSLHKYHKTHNQGVFDIYTPEMLKSTSQQDPYRSSGHLRTRTYRRRLPSCCPLRY